MFKRQLAPSQRIRHGERQLVCDGNAAPIVARVCAVAGEIGDRDIASRGIELTARQYHRLPLREWECSQNERAVSNGHRAFIRGLALKNQRAGTNLGETAALDFSQRDRATPLLVRAHFNDLCRRRALHIVDAGRRHDDLGRRTGRIVEIHKRARALALAVDYDAKRTQMGRSAEIGGCRERNGRH